MASSTSPMNVVIIGGSLSGLMHGVVLQRSGQNVHILERSPTIPEHRGAGLSIRPTVRKFLSTWDRPQKLSYIDAGVVSFLDREGRETKQWAMPLKSTSWASLYYRLRANFDGLHSDHYPEFLNEHEHLPTTSSQVKYELGRTVTDIKSEGGKVVIEHESTADAKDKTLTSADLVIVADGSSSRTRRILQPEANPTYAGYIAWRGLVPEELVSADLCEFFGNKFSYFSVKGDRGSLNSGERHLNWVWYCNYPPNSASFRDVMTVTDGQMHRNSLPVGKVRPSLWEQQKDLARKVFPTKIAEAVTLTTLPFIQAINEYRSTKATFFQDKGLLVGDALATCRPHSQSSGEQAAVHAVLLHEVLKNRISIQEWERKALNFSHSEFFKSKAYGSYWQHGLSIEFAFAFMCLVWSKLWGMGMGLDPPKEDLDDKKN